jgi:hypothetical protein
MKYLYLVISLAILLNASLAADPNYDGISFNEDISRKINLEVQSVVEVVSEIKFKPKDNSKSFNYYFVVPHEYEPNLVTLSASLTTTTEELEVKKVKAYPPELLALLKDMNSTDFSIYRINVNVKEDI